MTGVAPSVETMHPPRVGWLAVATLRDLGMPWAEIDAILGTDDPRLVRRYLELHAERLEERLAGQRALLLRVGSTLAAESIEVASPAMSAGLIRAEGNA